MKTSFILLLCFASSLAYAQKPAAILPKGEAPKKIENLADTVITRDATNPHREYWVIHSMKGVMTGRGYKVNAQKDGTWREYLDGSGIISKIIEYKEGKKNGACLTFNANGTVTTDESYLNDSLDGARIVYGTFGSKIKLIENYKKGLLDGVRKSFYDDAKIQEDAFYINGKKHGSVKWYMQNGNLSTEYTYDHGTLSGPVKMYDENGKVKEEGKYVNGDEEGEWKVYQDSVLVSRKIYKAGQIIKEVKEKK